MIARILAIALNTYREAVRARVLLGVFALALATCVYSLLVGTLSLHQESRVVADIGAAGVSLYGVLVAVVMGSTSLYRELELKTIFPILSRPIRRWEYLLGKYLGAMLTIAVFVMIDAAAVFAMLALEAGQPAGRVGEVAAAMLAVLGLSLLRVRHGRVYVFVPWALAIVVAMWFLAAPAMEDRQLVAASAVLSLSEIAIVAAIATLFSSFSSPFLTAVFTSLLWIIGRSADTMAHISKHQFGPEVAAFFRGVARVVPNLQVYVPSRALLLGHVAGQPVSRYVAVAGAHAAAYATGLLCVAILAFRKRDFA